MNEDNLKIKVEGVNLMLKLNAKLNELTRHRFVCTYSIHSIIERSIFITSFRLNLRNICGGARGIA
jgi:hypothetical protein